ncbi:MAG TPA: MFS transporter [Mucilaginibacter sp.]
MTEQLTHQKSPKQLRIGCAVFFFISGFGYSSWASRIPTIQSQLHLNEAQLGAVLFALPIGLMFTLPITGRLLSAYSSRYILLFGALFLNIVLTLIGITVNIWQLAITLFCLGSARNLLNISINAQAVGVQTLYKKSIMATFHGIWSLAGFAGAALGYIMVYYNVVPVYHFLAVSILLLLFSVYYFPFTYHDKPIPQTSKKIFSFPDKSLLRFAFICFASMACENTMYDWSGIYFEKVIHVDRATATFGFVIYIAAMTLGRFIGDKMINRYGVKLLLKLSGIFIFGGMLLAALLPYMATATLGFALVGLGVSCIVPMVFQIAGKSSTMSSGTALASISTIGYIGFLLVPPVVGFVAQAVNLRLSFGIIAMLGALVIIMVKGMDNK